MVGSINPGAPNKYDMIELQMPRTEKDGKITKKCTGSQKCVIPCLLAVEV